MGSGQRGVATRLMAAAKSVIARWGSLPVLAIAAVAYAVWLVALGRGQWFVTDEFGYFVPDSTALIVWLFTPHNEHSILTTKLWFNILFPLVGLRHYVLYLVPLVVAHVVAIALIYRLTWITTASRVLAAGTALMAAMMGAGAGTLTWAGQLQVVGSLAAGLFAIDLAFEPRTNWRLAFVAVTALIGALTGTAFVALALAAAAAFAYRRRWIESVLISFVPLVWLLVVRMVWAPVNPYGASSIDQVLRLGPGFAFTVLDTAISQTFGGVPTVAVLVALTTAVGAALWKPRMQPARQVVGTLTLATLASIAVLVIGRLGLPQTVARGGGYSYMLLLTIVPLIGITLGQFARSKVSVVAAVVIVVPIALLGYGRLTETARDLSAWRQQGARLMQASAVLLTRGAPVYSDQVPVPETAPTVSQAVIRSWVASGRLDAVDSGQVTGDQVSLNMQWRLGPDAELGGDCTSLGTGQQIDISPGAAPAVSAPDAPAAVAVRYPTSPAVRRFELATASTIQSVASRDAVVSIAAGSVSVCDAD